MKDSPSFFKNHHIPISPDVTFICHYLVNDVKKIPNNYKINHYIVMETFKLNRTGEVTL